MTIHERMRRDDGFTVIELMVGILLMSIVMSIMASSTIHAMKVQRRQFAEVDTVSRTRIAMERMTREIRAANPLLAASADGSEITVQVTRGTTGFNRKMTTYRLVNNSRIDVLTTLYNTSTSASSVLPPRTLLTGLAPAVGEPVFTYMLADGTPPPVGTDITLYRSVGITLRMALRESTETVVVRDTVSIRNAVVAP